MGILSFFQETSLVVAIFLFTAMYYLVAKHIKDITTSYIYAKYMIGVRIPSMIGMRQRLGSRYYVMLFHFFKLVSGKDTEGR